MAGATTLKLRRLWLQVHKWIGLLLAILIVPVCLSGSALVWHDWLDESLNPQRQAEGAAALAPSDYAAAASAALAPGERILSIRYPDGDGPVLVSAARPPETAGAGRRPVRTNLWLDPADGRVLDTAASDEGAVRRLGVVLAPLFVELARAAQLGVGVRIVAGDRRQLAEVGSASAWAAGEGEQRERRAIRVAQFVLQHRAQRADARAGAHEQRRQRALLFAREEAVWAVHVKLRARFERVESDRREPALGHAGDRDLEAAGMLRVGRGRDRVGAPQQLVARSRDVEVEPLSRHVAQRFTIGAAKDERLHRRR